MGNALKEIFAFALSLMVIPATALDEPRPPHQIAYGQYHAPEALVGLCTAAIVLFADRIIAYSSLLIGPSMGVTSVLWLMMRNDGAISPGSSWMVFGVWSVSIGTYLIIHCHRVANHHLFVLLTIAVAVVCMYLVANVQATTLQGGLATAIPTCASFAAYTVAYFFPKKTIGHLEERDAMA